MPADWPAAVRRPRRLATALAALLAAAPWPVAAATVEVTVSNVAVDGGNILASLCEGALDQNACRRGQSQPAGAATVVFLFPDVAPGRYAALAFQDGDGGGVLRRSRMGRPLDPYGLSNGAGRSRRPTFEQAAVRVGPAGARIAVRLERSGGS